MHGNYSSVSIRVRLALQIVLLLFSSAAISYAQADLPPGPGRVELERMCSRCHGLNVITGQRMSARLWTEEVHDMISRGATGTASVGGSTGGGGGGAGGTGVQSGGSGDRTGGIGSSP